MKCDFCNIEAVKWDYPAKSFALFVAFLNVMWGSNGGWGACHACHAIIERGDREALLARAIAMIGTFGQDPEFDAAMTAAMRELHAQFFAHRLGPALPAAVA
jgi:hypothetical protein